VFYSQIGLSDSIDLLWRINEDTALNIFLERSYRHSGFSAAEHLAIETVAPLVFAAAAKHHALTAASSRREVDTLTHRKVQSTIENFASSLLTQRERQVLFYMISGYSSALTAQRLNTSEGTIKIHRKNIHRKLDIGSQAELFSLFINCIPFAQPGHDHDPLQAYQSAPAPVPVAARDRHVKTPRACTAHPGAPVGSGFTCRRRRSRSTWRRSSGSCHWHGWP
jgi:DNA-binding CsgD family transcriptional regulator